MFHRQIRMSAVIQPGVAARKSLRIKQGAGFYGLAFYIFASGPGGDTIKSYLFLSIHHGITPLASRIPIRLLQRKHPWSTATKTPWRCCGFQTSIIRINHAFMPPAISMRRAVENALTQIPGKEGCSDDPQPAPPGI